MPEVDLDILIEDPRWNTAVPDLQESTQTLIETIFKYTHTSNGNIEISLVLANDPFIQNLNRDYRGKDKPTNVLSFPQTESTEDFAAIPHLSLGDIIISYDTIRNEALEQSKDFMHHYTHMLIHGCLHLLHYDHENDEDADKMENMEILILRALNIKNPYES